MHRYYFWWDEMRLRIPRSKQCCQISAINVKAMNERSSFPRCNFIYLFSYLRSCKWDTSVERIYKVEWMVVVIHVTCTFSNQEFSKIVHFTPLRSCCLKSCRVKRWSCKKQQNWMLQELIRFLNLYRLWSGLQHYNKINVILEWWGSTFNWKFTIFFSNRTSYHF